MRQVGIRFGTRLMVAASLFLAACAPASQPPAAPAATSAPAAAKPAAAPTSAPAAAPAAAGGNLVFFSNQFKPVEEQAKMQDIILKNAPSKWSTSLRTRARSTIE